MLLHGHQLERAVERIDTGLAGGYRTIRKPLGDSDTDIYSARTGQPTSADNKFHQLPHELSEYRRQAEDNGRQQRKPRNQQRDNPELYPVADVEKQRNVSVPAGTRNNASGNAVQKDREKVPRKIGGDRRRNRGKLRKTKRYFPRNAR